MSVALLVDSVVLCAFFVLLKVWFSKAGSSPPGLLYPPGPKPLPIVGNIFDIPKAFSYKTYAAWGKQYGGLIHLTAFGNHIVVINSMRVAVELLEKRSKTYSDRPELPMVKLLGWDWNIGFQPYGESWRRRRREFHQHFRADKSVEYNPNLMKNAREFLHNLLVAPDNFSSHIRQYSGTVIMSIVYDYDAAPENDHFVDIAEEAIEMLNPSTHPGGAIVNEIPIIRHLPAWLPGMAFKKFAQRCHKLTTEMKNAPMDLVKTRMESGISSNCVANELFSRLCDSEGRISTECEEVIKDVTAVSYAAGADTTVSAIRTSFLAMVLYPQAMEKAQKEIDIVIGNTRLPGFEDRKSLPYVESFFREVLRWHPVLPMFPRSAYEDDIYEGQFVPKGATVLMNTWAIHYDEDMYPEPAVFKPERFLEPGGSISERYPITTFGLGRRGCPGRYMADSIVWVAIALVLTTFDVTKAKDEAGQELDVTEEYTDGLSSYPAHFVCSIKPRSKHAEFLIREACLAVQD